MMDISRWKNLWHIFLRTFVFFLVEVQKKLISLGFSFFFYLLFFQTSVFNIIASNTYGDQRTDDEEQEKEKIIRRCDEKRRRTFRIFAYIYIQRWRVNGISRWIKIYIYIDRKMWNVFISWSFTLDGFIDEEEEKKERNDQFSLSFMT